MNSTNGIISLRISNVMRIRAARIKPDGALVRITGKNRQGKTSVLDAIQMALGGKSTFPPEPIHRGAEEGEVILELENMTVTRRWLQSGASVLKVTTPDGEQEFKRPQDVLNLLYNSLSFDALAFMGMRPSEQLATLKQIAGIDFDRLDAEHKREYEARTIVNRDLKRLQGVVDDCGECDEYPDEEVSVSDLIAESNAAAAHITDFNHRVQLNADRLVSIEENRRRIGVIEEDNQKLTNAMALSQADLDDRKDDLPNLDAIKLRLENAETTNDQARQKAKYVDAIANRNKAKENADGSTKRLGEIADEKAKLVAAAEMPVDGLEFGENGVLYNGFALEQASSAEQLRVSAAMGLALNPKLRILLIRNGSLLDSKSRAELAKFAEEQKAQIWIEEVTDGEDVGFVIEDGEVANAR